MKSDLFERFGIPVTECEVEARVTDDNVPRLLFRSPGNPLVGLDMGGATKLQQMMLQQGDATNAAEIGRLIDQARRLL